MAVRDLSTEFCNVADLLDLARDMMVENMTRISRTEDVGYTMRHGEADQLSALLVVTSEYAGRIRREMDAASIEAIKRFDREGAEGGAL